MQDNEPVRGTNGLCVLYGTGGWIGREVGFRADARINADDSNAAGGIITSYD